MKLSVIQTHLYWEDKEKNISNFENLIKTIQDVGVIILPEMFTTGFTMNSPALAEHLDGFTTKWLIQRAKDKNCCITGSFITTNGNQFFNTLLWVYPDGNYKFYHKRHLFRMADEHRYYSYGKDKIICEYKGFRFLPLICYDLRFPVWSRNQFETENEYDVLIYVANWPSVRIEAWKKLLYARAIENLSYAIGVNRIGKDNAGKEYNGQSMAVNFKGDLMTSANAEEKIITIELNKEDLKLFRESFPAHLDADYFELKI